MSTGEKNGHGSPRSLILHGDVAEGLAFISVGGGRLSHGHYSSLVQLLQQAQSQEPFLAFHALRARGWPGQEELP